MTSPDDDRDADWLDPFQVAADALTMTCVEYGLQAAVDLAVDKALDELRPARYVESESAAWSRPVSIAVELVTDESPEGLVPRGEHWDVTAAEFVDRFRQVVAMVREADA